MLKFKSFLTQGKLSSHRKHDPEIYLVNNQTEKVLHTIYRFHYPLHLPKIQNMVHSLQKEESLKC